MATRRRSTSSRERAKRQRHRKSAQIRAALRTELSEQLGDHRSDVLAITLGVLGVLSVLGILSHLAGPFGVAINTSAGVVLGRGRIVVPIALLLGAILTIAQRGEEVERRGLRLGLGLTLCGLATVGLLHFAHGSPGGDSLEPLENAGGVVGALVGAPLSALLGAAGGVIVLVAVGVLGLLLVAGTGLRQVLTAVAYGLRVAGGYARDVLAMLTYQPTPMEDADVGVPELYDQVLDDTRFEAKARIDRTSKRSMEVEEDEEEEDEEGLEEYDEDEEYEEEEEEEEDEEGYEEYDEDEEYEEEDEEEEEEEEDEEGEYDEDEEYEDEEEEEEGDGEVIAAHAEQLTINLAAARPAEWKLPAASALRRSTAEEVDPRIVEEGGEILEATMREFGVDARLSGYTVGPTVTRYELELAPGVKVSKVTGLAKEIAYSMASHDVRILAPIPGRSAIGVEVPNKNRPIVTLGDVLASSEAKKAVHPLEVGMGRDIAGRAILPNLSTFPHVLIAGQTGAGKSSCINSIVTSLLMRTTPDQVRLILVDPKRVELGQYNGVPHLLTEVVTSPKKAANVLDWAVREMEMRYDVLAEVGVRDITGYNAMHDRGDLPTATDPDPDTGKYYERLPFIVVVVDELADLMMVAARDVEASICRLAEMARAVGIHLVIATQRPSVDVITGVIKANIPSRLAFSVSTLADSRVILDQQGAEKLVGKGDMLMLTASSSRLERVQGAWVDEECVRKVVAHWRRQAAEPLYVEGIQGSDAPGGSGNGRSGGDDDDDDLLAEAMELIVRSGLGSTSMLQRKLRVGFARAGRLMDLLERRGIVGPSEGSKARAVLMTVEEFEDMHADT